MSAVARYVSGVLEEKGVSEEEVLEDFGAFRREHLEEARRILASRDPEDAHPLALARVLSLPLWSNDSDLADVGVDCYTTARLLKVLSSER
jgi:predicted nucleic acid-binding protein